MTRRSRFLAAVAILALVPLFGSPASMQQPVKRPIQLADIIAWKSPSATALSSDGQWYAYRLGPQGADRPGGSDLVLRELATGAELNVGNVSEFSFRRDGRTADLR